MCKKKKYLICIIFIGVIILLKNVSYAGTQKLNALDYNVKVKDNGDMDIVETWDIYIDETNTLFKDFDLNSKKYGGVENVIVKNLDTNTELTEIDEEMYHVTEDCYYGLPISGNKFEIAWGVGLDNSSDTRRYEISYTVKGAVKVYNDCSEIYWMFISTSNGIPAKKVTGNIVLPQKIQDLEKLRVWAHGPLDGEIFKVSNNTVGFEVKNFKSETMLETRIVVEEPMFKEVNFEYNIDKLNNILEEEGKWADKANEERTKAKLTQYGKIFINVVLFIFFLLKIFKYIGEYQKVKANNKNNSIDIGKYFRDIPRENDATPAQAVFLYDLNNNGFSETIMKSEVFSATILQLCLKGVLAIEKENNEIKIIIKSKDYSKLKSDELEIMEVLEKVSDDYNSFTMKDLKEYARKNYDFIYDMMTNVFPEAKKEYIRNGKYDKEREEEANKLKSKGNRYIIIAIILISCMVGVFILPTTIELIICGIIIIGTSLQINLLTEEGEIERQQWKGLKNYMEDFSLLKDRDIPDLVLWEKYLIYATAFGISDKVIKQLKIVYPQFNNLDNNTYTYMYLMSDNYYGSNFINDFTKNISTAYDSYRSAYSSAHSSSSGGGGGFSGGGGGRWWRRPEWAEDRRKI